MRVVWFGMPFSPSHHGSMKHGCPLSIPKAWQLGNGSPGCWWHYFPKFRNFAGVNGVYKVNSVTMGLPACTTPGHRGCSWCIMSCTCKWTSSKMSFPTSEGDSKGGHLWSSDSSCCTLVSKASAFSQSFWACMASARALSMFYFKAFKSAQSSQPAVACAFSSSHSSRDQKLQILMENSLTASYGPRGVQVINTAALRYHKRPSHFLVGQTAPWLKNPVHDYIMCIYADSSFWDEKLEARALGNKCRES